MRVTNKVVFMKKRNLFMCACALLAVLAASGCEVTGAYAVGVPVDETCTTTPDANQISIIDQTSYVPNYLTVSLNNGAYVFDECAPPEAQSSQGEFQVRRGANTEIQIGLPTGTTLSELYFPEGPGSNPYRSDVTVRIMGRSNCAQSPTTIVSTTTLPIGWEPMNTGYAMCAGTGWLGTALIR
jgi:hypothetical protein